MNFLQLVQRTARACYMTNSGNVPAATANQTGELLNAVDWVADAWRELQVSNNNWRWMRSRFSVDTSVGVDEYAPSVVTDVLDSALITRFAQWLITDRKNPPKVYRTAGGIGSQYFLQYLDWYQFRTLYRIGDIQDGQPVHITIDPQDNLVLGPRPDDEYTITGEYQRGVMELVDEEDVPDMPTRFHMVIVYDAMLKYAGSEGAEEVMTRAQLEGGALKSALKLDQLPRIRSSSPMA